MPLVNGDVKLIQVVGGKHEEIVLAAAAGQFLKFNGSKTPISSAIATSDVTGLDTALSGKQAASTHLDNYVSAGAGIVKKGSDGTVTSLASTSYGEGLLNVADAAAARTYLGVASALGSLNYQGTLGTQSAVDGIVAAASGNKGWYYVVTTGTSETISGNTATNAPELTGLTFGSGDWIVSNGTTWEKVNAQINDGEITTLKIVDSAVTTAKIAAGAVTDTKLATDSVTTVKIAAGAVTDVKLATDSVTTVKILDSAVTAAKLATDAVTTVKILDGAVTDTKLATDSVTTVKIQNSAVTLAKIQNIGANTILANLTGSSAAPSAYAPNSVIVDLLKATSAANARAAISALGWSSVPATSTSTGTAGELAYDADYLYICVGTDLWSRVALAATWSA